MLGRTTFPRPHHQGGRNSLGYRQAGSCGGGGSETSQLLSARTADGPARNRRRQQLHPSHRPARADAQDACVVQCGARAALRALSRALPLSAALGADAAAMSRARQSTPSCDASSVVDLSGIEVGVRPAVRFREQASGRGVSLYLSLYDDELEERAEAFWSHAALPVRFRSTTRRRAED